MPDISTLVHDINSLFSNGHICSQENAEKLGKAIADTVVRRLKEASQPDEPFRLRMSNLGKPDKQLWYEAHSVQPREQLPPQARIKFLFGDILENLLIFLAKEAGHEVTDEQRGVEYCGISGSMDCRIDRVLVDVKSASTRSFEKFYTGSLRRNDPFGYMWQLSGYGWADGVTDSGFLVIDKTLGHICFMGVDKEEIKLYNIPERIAHMKAVLASPDPPERCFIDVPDGKSGNMKLDTTCSYCAFKGECWPGLRTFLYSNGPRFLTKVKRVPQVTEVLSEEQLAERLFNEDGREQEQQECGELGAGESPEGPDDAG